MIFPKNDINSKEIKFKLNKELYLREAILKTLYWYSGDFIFELDVNDNYFFLKLNPIQEKSLDEMKLIFQKLNQDLIDFQVRQTIHIETKNIRDLITAKAFSNGQLDELPKGDISDPIGFTQS